MASRGVIPGRSSIVVLLLTGVPLAHGQYQTPDWAEGLVRNTRASSFPELARKDIRIKPFASNSDYFRAQFSILRFIFGWKMRYVIRVNSGATILTAPVEARQAILAHELAHVGYYARGNRLHLLGLLRLFSRGFRERFEKRADVEAVKRGYGQGLKEYRTWLYQHVPVGSLPEKMRDYLSTEEIDALKRQIDK